MLPGKQKKGLIVQFFFVFFFFPLLPILEAYKAVVPNLFVSGTVSWKKLFSWTWECGGFRMVQVSYIFCAISILWQSQDVPP